MRQFKAAFANELMRVFRKKKTVVFCIIDIVIIGFYALFQLLYRMAGVSTVNITSALGSLHGLFFMFVFPLFIFMETMDVFTKEMNNSAIKNAIIRPVTRTKVYLAKVFAVCAFILSQIVFVGIVGTAVTMSMGGSSMSMAKSAAAYAITFIPLIAFVFLAAFIAQIVKNGLLGMLLGILFLIVSYVTEMFMPYVSAFIFVRHINIYKMIITGNIQFQGILSALFIIIAYIGVTFTAGTLIFNRKEF